MACDTVLGTGEAGEESRQRQQPDRRRRLDDQRIGHGSVEVTSAERVEEHRPEDGHPDRRGELLAGIQDARRRSGFPVLDCGEDDVEHGSDGQAQARPGQEHTRQ
jgi:hypothetical protein